MAIKSKTGASKWLRWFGYLETTRPTVREFGSALREMQNTYGLKRDGKLGPITKAAMGLFRCGCTDKKALRIAGSSDCRWEKKKLIYWHSSRFTLPGVGRTASMRIIRQGFDIWEDYTNLKFRRSSSKKNIDIHIVTGAGQADEFDGPGNVLAWAEMPCGGADTKLLTAFDRQEPWSADLAKRPGIFMLSVWVHELGHLLGLDHSDNAKDIMAPYYNPQIWLPQAGDIARIRKNYVA